MTLCHCKRFLTRYAFLFLFCSTAAQAQGTPEPAWINLEKSGKYQEAVNSLQLNPTYDHLYFFNLGVLWGKLNQNGLATANLEKANRLRPHDPEITRNLKYARSLLLRSWSSNDELVLDQASNTIEQIADRIHHEEMLGVLGLVLLIVSIFWIRAYLKTRSIMKTFLKPSGWFGAFAVSISFAFYGIYRTGTQNPPAVALYRQPLRSGPGLNYPEITNIESGLKVRMMGAGVVVGENELWQKVRYKPAQVGWIPLSNLLPL